VGVKENEIIENTVINDFKNQLNPFVKETQVTFKLRESGNVKIEVLIFKAEELQNF